MKFTDGVGIVKPETVAEDEHANAVFDEAIDTILTAYQTMLEAGIPAEDARYILPNAAESKIVITMNIRELLHFFELRCCNRAQWEIRELAHRMLELVRPTAPYIFKDAGAGCVRGACPEGKMTCGNPFPRVIARLKMTNYPVRSTSDVKSSCERSLVSFHSYMFRVSLRIVFEPPWLKTSPTHVKSGKGASCETGCNREEHCSAEDR